MSSIAQRFRDLGRILYDAKFPASIIHVPMGAATGAVSTFALATYATRHPSMVGKVLYDIGFIIGATSVGIEATREVATNQYSALPVLIATNLVSFALEYSRAHSRAY